MKRQVWKIEEEKTYILDKKQSNSATSKKPYFEWALCIGLLIILGSCVKEVNDIGGGHDSNQEIVMVCLGYLFSFIIFLCLLIWLQIKLEKLFLDKEEIERRDKAQLKFARKEMKKMLGPLYSIFSAFTKKNDKK